MLLERETMLFHGRALDFYLDPLQQSLGSVYRRSSHIINCNTPDLNGDTAGQKGTVFSSHGTFYHKIPRALVNIRGVKPLPQIERFLKVRNQLPSPAYVRVKYTLEIGLMSDY